MLAVAGLVGASTGKCRLAGAQQRPADGHELGTMSSAAVGRPRLAGRPPHPTACFPQWGPHGSSGHTQGWWPETIARDWPPGTTNKIAGNKIAGNKIAGNKIAGNKILTRSLAGPPDRPASSGPK